ncbi:MAG: thiamine pyrophosphate-binding protein [Actinobacteria bacterium]|nr:MAG: thiamine pyrophosphate-binding protein [Actinomycetota bacterium]
MSKVRVADYIVKRIADLGVKDVFMISGGGAMHLDDALSREKRLNYICNHHEQASAIAVEGYSRVTGDIGVAIVTTGPGGTNTITGVLGQWHDSVPGLFISGQVKYETTVASTGLPLRQLGDQEADIVKIVSPITKYAVMITDPKSIRYHFEKAVYLATNGRPGPVWLDIPLNVQATLVDENELEPFLPEEGSLYDKNKVITQIDELIKRIKSSSRPVILAGSGIRIGNAYQKYFKVIERLSVPVLTSWKGLDLMYEDHPLFFGRPSTVGDRAGNFILQNSDLLISIGCRLNVRQIGYEFKSVARKAFKVIVDIDPNELKKPTIFPDMSIHSDVNFFFSSIDKKLGAETLEPKDDWLNWCRQRKDKFPVVLDEYKKETDYVNPYVFIDTISELLDEEEIMVSANGAACVITFQAIKLKRGQRVIGNSGTASMGYDLPAAIGACFANNKKRVICFAGDGSIQMNIQELQTIVHHQLPIKIFIFNNAGYLSIRQTQDNLFKGHYVGESTKSGVSFPDMLKIGQAYGIKALRINNHQEMAGQIQESLETSGPVICDIVMSPKQIFMPKVSSQRLSDGSMVSKPLEDMYPFLDREEFFNNMLVSEWEPKG